MLQDTVADSELTAQLGAIEANDDTPISDVTHLITDAIKRTDKLLTIYSSNVPIVNRTWIEKSVEAGHFINTAGHELHDGI